MWARARGRFLDNRLAVVGFVAIVILFGAGLLANQIAPYGYLEVNVKALSHGPSWAHPFGTDQLGRDYLSRVLYGIGTEARIAMLVGFVGTLIGTLVGAVAGYFGGAVGEVLMRLTDLLMTLPPLVTIFVAAAYLHVTTTLTISLLLASLLWMPIARIVRGTCLSLREKEYVEAARAMGATDVRIILRHILPNAIGSVNVAATSLGDVMADANVEGLFHWWGLFFPGLILVLVVMSVYFVGDGVRDALDPEDGRRAPRRGDSSRPVKPN